MWRKTRSFNATISATCYGVDPNRNFDIEFNTVSVSPDPCSQIYPGHEAFSEPETRYVRDILLEYNNRIQVFMDVHSYGNYIVYGFDNGTLPQNALHIHHVGALMGASIDTLKLQKAPFYIVGNSRYVFYAVSGSGQDYAQVCTHPYIHDIKYNKCGMSKEYPLQCYRDTGWMFFLVLNICL